MFSESLNTYGLNRPDRLNTMKVKIENLSAKTIRITTDLDDLELEAGDADVFESNLQGMIEIREVDEDEQGGVREPEPVD